MSVDEEEQCIALTQSGERCSRIAKHEGFCFQHDESSPTVGSIEPTSEGFLSIVADDIETRPEQFTGVRRDIAENVNNIVSNANSLAEAASSFDLAESLEAFKKTVTQTGPTTGTGALIGGVVGSPFGPIGIATGSTIGGWYGVYRSMQDERALAATVDESPPEGAPITPSDHEAIADIDPIQLTLQSALENEGNQTEWLRSTLTRERDMDSVAEALDQIPQYESEDGNAGYYIREVTTGKVLVLVFGIPQSNPAEAKE